MRRLVVVMLTAAATLALVVVAAFAMTDGGPPDDASDSGAHGMMSSSMLDKARGDHVWQMGSQARMDGPAVSSEFEYLTEMVAHHEEAIAAARQLQRSGRPQMRRFGQSIVATQSAQVDRMKKRLADWYPGRSTDVEYQPMMRELTRRRGERLDRAFLQDMIGHHMAAVMMSQTVIVRDLTEHRWVEILARTIRNDQHAEIFQMRRWLDRWW